MLKSSLILMSSSSMCDTFSGLSMHPCFSSPCWHLPPWPLPRFSLLSSFRGSWSSTVWLALSSPPRTSGASTFLACSACSTSGASYLFFRPLHRWLICFLVRQVCVARTCFRPECTRTRKSQNRLFYRRIVHLLHLVALPDLLGSFRGQQHHHAHVRDGVLWYLGPHVRASVPLWLYCLGELGRRSSTSHHGFWFCSARRKCGAAARAHEGCPRTTTTD